MEKFISIEVLGGCTDKGGIMMMQFRKTFDLEIVSFGLQTKSLKNNNFTPS